MGFLCTYWADYLAPLLMLTMPLFLVIVPLSMLTAAIVGRWTAISFRAALAQISAYAWLGAVCGFIAGASLEPLVGALLTGTLTIVSALLSYVFSGNPEDPRAKAVPLAIIILCVSALIGLSIGRSYRKPWDDYRKTDELLKTRVDQIDRPLLKMQEQYALCRKLIPAQSINSCNEILTR